MTALDELRRELEKAANQGEEAFQRALDALGPDAEQKKRFDEWLADPENRERWNKALHGATINVEVDRAESVQSEEGK